MLIAVVRSAKPIGLLPLEMKVFSSTCRSSKGEPEATYTPKRTWDWFMTNRRSRMVTPVAETSRSAAGGGFGPT